MEFLHGGGADDEAVGEDAAGQGAAYGFGLGHELGRDGQRCARARAGERRVQDVEAHIALGVFKPQALGERLECALRRGIGRQAGEAGNAHAGAGEQYPSARADARKRGSGEVNGAEIVYIKRGAVLLDRHVRELRKRAETGVLNGGVQPAEGRRSAADRGAERVKIPHVGLIAEQPAIVAPGERHVQADALVGAANEYVSHGTPPVRRRSGGRACRRPSGTRPCRLRRACRSEASAERRGVSAHRT